MRVPTPGASLGTGAGNAQTFGPSNATWLALGCMLSGTSQSEGVNGAMRGDNLIPPGKGPEFLLRRGHFLAVRPSGKPCLAQVGELTRLGGFEGIGSRK